MNQTDVKRKWITQELLRHCGPIIIGPSLKASPDREISNGTYALVDTGTKNLLITCCHVWHAYLEAHDRNAETRLGLSLAHGSSIISFKHPESQLIAADRDLDLAVFDFAIPVPCKKDWFRIADGAAPPPQKGDFIATLGFPGAWRGDVPGGCRFEYRAIRLKVSEVSDRTIVVWREDADNAEVLEDMQNCWGGISGSPAYRFDEDGTPHLLGFVKAGPQEREAGHESGPAQNGGALAGALFLVRADLLQPDGSLKNKSTQ